MGEFREIFNKATNPKQYDSEDIFWDQEAGLEGKSRYFFFEYIEPYLKDLNNKDVLDIGSGGGWLLDQIKSKGARVVVGIEPSQRNAAISKQNFSDAEVAETTLQDFSGDAKFDLVISNMAFSHINDLEQAFKKISNLLRLDAKLIITVPDFEYFKMDKFNQQFQVEAIDENTYAVLVRRPTGAVADVVRKNVVYEKEAAKSNLKLVGVTPMLPTETMQIKSPKYIPFAKQPLAQLLSFKLAASPL